MMPRLLLVCLLLLPWTACQSDRDREPTIGEGFVAPVTLNLRRELGPRQPTVATVKHGERLEILRRRRVFVKVRTPSGDEGWADGRLLFSPEQMEDLRRLAEQTRQLPSQGAATVFSKLNLHSEPNRQAPSFHQLKEGERVEVVFHQLAARVPYRPGAQPERAAPGVASDDWSLVRSADGRAGWALFSMLTMAIPDEVAQYAEGHRITSYFQLGTVEDGDRVKANWLWTTITRGLEPYEFDGVRVFVWSRRRHRYETAYIERNLKGYYPVEVHAGREAVSPPRFFLVVEGKDGTRQRRTYAFQGFRIRLVSREPWQTPPPRFGQGSQPPSEHWRREQPPFFTRLKDAITGLWRRD